MNSRRLRSAWKIRFSLRTLLILAPLAAAALAFVASRFIRHNEVTVAGLLDVHPRAFVTLWQYPPKGPNDDLMERTSDDTLLRAMGFLPPSSRAWIDAKGDPLAWMRSNVRVRLFANSEIVRVSIVHFTPTDNDIAAETDIINAILRTFDNSKPIMFMGQPMSFPVIVPSPTDPRQYIATDFQDVRALRPAEGERPGWF